MRGNKGMDSITNVVVPQAITYLMKREGVSFDELKERSGIDEKYLRKILYGEAEDVGVDDIMDIGEGLGIGRLGVFRFIDMFASMQEDEKLLLFWFDELPEMEKVRALEKMKRLAEAEYQGNGKE